MSSSPTIIGFDGCPMVRRHGLTRRWNGGTAGNQVKQFVESSVKESKVL
jgi:hypothetical protein